ncbi:ZZ-type zinc finger-containing protein 3-like [Oncorhynchus clarkii lewisi]|uniref:ZZ-type zinc finger-containing protein 3-like n=1 Tax=Oncorhynchus clarkii lewisi TaxID=490388 RepID=UPI0039B978B9
MAASRSSRVTRSSVGLNGLDENFCGRTLRNRSIAQPEECQGSPLPGSRAPRSPKKRQDDQAGASEKPGGHQGKVAHHKATSVDGETWASPRKRVLSCSEREGVGGSEKAENCEGRGKETSGAVGRDASPLLKRAKRCFRSGESHGSKDDLPFAPPMPVIPASPCAPLTTVKENSEGGDLLRQNSTAASPSSSSPDLNKEEGEEEEDDGHVQQLLNSNSHKSCIGLGQTSSSPDAQTNSLCLSAASNTTCPGPGPALLNGSQRGAPCPSPPDPVVPCRNYDAGQEEDSDPGMEEEGKDSGECPAPLLASFEEDSSTPHLSVREEEVEVTPTEEESCGGGINGWSFMPLVVQNTVATSIIINNNIINNNINNVNNNNNNSGEFTMPLLAPPTRSDPPCTPSISSTSPPSFTEPHEHRYTLRTSPRRAACGGGKAVAPCSSPRDPLREGVEAGRELVATPTLSSCSSIQAREGSLLSPPSVPMEQGNGGARRDRVGWDSTGHGELCETRGGLAEVPGGGSQQEDDPDVYYFESDHLTLKHNKDYQRLLQTVGVLEAQRTQSIRDLERLARQQREALRDPVSFVEQLQKQVELDLPRPQRVVQLPDVAWDQYTSGLGDFEREFCDKKRTTRRLKLIFDKVRLPDGPKSPLDPKKEEGEPSTLYSALPSSDALENSNNSQRIRGRLCYQSKPDTFNQLWTAEEQKKLEHLLLQFSPEEVESKRWQKIADALGNRTSKQVASRVQKYFIKLTKAGIPVPGRTPNMCIYSKKVSNKRQHHLNKHLYRPSTFLTSYEPPVFMEEEDERAAYYSSLQDPDGDDTDEEGVPVELRHLPEYKELLELKRMKKHKLQEIQAESSMALHHGYKCDVCGVEPIQGVRWHCQDCPSDNAVDFCSNCSDCLYKTESHLPSHHLEPVHHHETFLDRDYCLAQTPGYNYLDPNYYPANR